MIANRDKFRVFYYLIVLNVGVKVYFVGNGSANKGAATVQEL